MLDGEHIEWYPNNKLKSYCYLKNDKFNGEYRRWYESGEIEIMCNYKDDKLDGEYFKNNKEGII